MLTNSSSSGQHTEKEAGLPHCSALTTTTTILIKVGESFSNKLTHGHFITSSGRKVTQRQLLDPTLAAHCSNPQESSAAVHLLLYLLLLLLLLLLYLLLTVLLLRLMVGPSIAVSPSSSQLPSSSVLMLTFPKARITRCQMRRTHKL
jgi:hypothetical protein